MYYLAESCRAQLGRTDDYSQLQPTVLIAFLCDPMYPEVADYHLTFQLREKRHPIVFTPDLEIHTIELSKLSGRPDEASPQLDRWSYFLSFAKGHEMAQFPEVMQEDPIFQQAFEELERMSHDPSQREAYHLRLRDLREEKTRINSAVRQGRAEGRALQLRRQIGAFERMLHLSATAESVLDAMSSDELERRVAELENQIQERIDRRNGNGST